MSLSDSDIKNYVQKGKLKISPFTETALSPAGYDLSSANTKTLNSLESGLFHTLERIELPNNILGILHLRSSFTREGVIGSLALVDPGFKGQLTILLFNSGKEAITIKKSEPFIQITFFRLEKSASAGYRGRYQNSKGVVRSLRTHIEYLHK